MGLKVVHAWWVEYGEAGAASSIRSDDWQMFAQEDEALVAESLTGWQEKYPDVTVRRHSVRAFPVGALAHQSKNACLVVVGTRGRGGFAGLALGSVSQGVMHRARCPVAIVHSSAEPHHIRQSTGHLWRAPSGSRRPDAPGDVVDEVSGVIADEFGSHGVRAVDERAADMVVVDGLPGDLDVDDGPGCVIRSA